MKKSDFGNPSGTFQDNPDGHSTFVPDDLPPKIDHESIMSLTAEAHTSLGFLGGLGEIIPNPDLLIMPYINREAVLSSKIEGTQASIIDVFRFEARGKRFDRQDGEKRVKEVINYSHALKHCLDRVSKGDDIDLGMIKEAHRILMQNVRGGDKTPGMFRKVQNWIGPPSSQIRDATYVPPSADLLPDLLAKMSAFVSEPPTTIPVLVQCAMLHYQFEAIHPFADGNGRVGRMLIPVLLSKSRVLKRPILYPSAYFEQNRSSYYERLLNVSRNGEWTEWIKFFLTGVIHQSRETASKIKQMMSLQREYKSRLSGIRTSQRSVQLVEYIFAQPVVTIPMTSHHLGITYPPAKSAINNLMRLGILEEYDTRRRQKLYVAKEIINLLT